MFKALAKWNKQNSSKTEKIFWITLTLAIWTYFLCGLPDYDFLEFIRGLLLVGCSGVLIAAILQGWCKFVYSRVYDTYVEGSDFLIIKYFKSALFAAFTFGVLVIKLLLL